MVFFPQKGDRKAIEFARSVCHRCPVITQFLEHALSWPESDGIWGGKAPYQREKERTRRRRQ